jgi:hypothetical protein
LFGVCADWIAKTIKKRADLIGVDPDVIGGHSLRAGLITTAVERGVDPFTVANFARHKDPRQTLGYVRGKDNMPGSPAASASDPSLKGECHDQRQRTRRGS